jgi:hypothetical protein
MAGQWTANMAMAEGVADYETERNACMGRTVFADDHDHALPHSFACVFVCFIHSHPSYQRQRPITPECPAIYRNVNTAQFDHHLPFPVAIFSFQTFIRRLMPRHLSASPFRLSKAPLNRYLLFLALAPNSNENSHQPSSTILRKHAPIHFERRLSMYLFPMMVFISDKKKEGSC